MSQAFVTGLLCGVLCGALPFALVRAWDANRRVQRAMLEHPATKCDRGYAKGKCSWPACACGVERGAYVPDGVLRTEGSQL